MIERDKNGDPVLVRLSQPVVEAILSYNWQAGPRLFGYYTLKNRRNLYRDLRAACERAGVTYFTPHKAGRHAFAKRLLKAGKSLAHVKAAGKWKTIRVVAELYGAFESSEVDDDVLQVGDQWAAKLGTHPDNVVSLKKSGEKR